mmetsp:Transcript_91672/g.213183  ORF Transcript_91672/g.213183 Transcript_91672/m.213183 type:complete len:428 (+) Transcript_91672:504-1787(+)
MWHRDEFSHAFVSNALPHERLLQLGLPWSHVLDVLFCTSFRQTFPQVRQPVGHRSVQRGEDERACPSPAKDEDHAQVWIILHHTVSPVEHAVPGVCPQGQGEERTDKGDHDQTKLPEEAQPEQATVPALDAQEALAAVLPNELARATTHAAPHARATPDKDPLEALEQALARATTNGPLQAGCDPAAAEATPDAVLRKPDGNDVRQEHHCVDPLHRVQPYRPTRVHREADANLRVLGLEVQGSFGRLDEETPPQRHRFQEIAGRQRQSGAQEKLDHPTVLFANRCHPDDIHSPGVQSQQGEARADDDLLQIVKGVSLLHVERQVKTQKFVLGDTSDARAYWHKPPRHLSFGVRFTRPEVRLSFSRVGCPWGFSGIQGLHGSETLDWCQPAGGYPLDCAWQLSEDNQTQAHTQCNEKGTGHCRANAHP